MGYQPYDRTVKRESILYKFVHGVVERVREFFTAPASDETTGLVQEYWKIHEFGTDRIPPRPIISKETATVQTEKDRMTHLVAPLIGSSVDPEKTLEELMAAHRRVEKLWKGTTGS